MMHGWLDGRRGIPPLPQSPNRPVNGTAIPAAESHLKEIAKPPGEPGPASSPALLQTPRIEVLSRQALELIEGEKIRFEDDRAVLQRESARFLQVRDALADELAVAEEKLKDARSPLSSQEREDRRIAEQDSQSRPAGLVRARRQAAWDRRLGVAEQQYQATVIELAGAVREAELRKELIQDREAVARAAARRHHEFAMRRIATYLQQLVRTHRRGAELSLLLIRHPVGPDLPEWTRDPQSGRPRAEQARGKHSEPITGDSYLKNEASGL